MAEPLYSIEALRAIEHRAAADDATALMERAGQAGWRTLLDAWPRTRRIVVVCGPGNNGGDGLVLARHAHQAGCEVRVVHHACHPPRTDAARAVHVRARDAGVAVAPFDAVLPACDVLVDAVLGIGLSRAPDEAVQAMLDAIRTHAAPVLSLDVPSGIDAASGHAHRGAVHASRTLEFIAPKIGLRTGAARGHVGVLACDGLGVPAGRFSDVAPGAHAWAADDLATQLPARAIDSHKGTHGRVLCIGGDLGHGGAILLAAEGALRAGAGLVAIETRRRHVAPALARMPEAMADAACGTEAVRAQLDAATVCVIGPGLGQGAWSRARFDAACAHGVPLVLDADGLNFLSASPTVLPPGSVLTPHPGEAARLLQCDTAQVQRDRLDAARRIADAHQAVVVLKGAGTVVHAPGATACLIDAGNPGMAVGGMGDVLAGIIGALRAQGLDAFDAARTGALLHACAGDAAARDGERGLLPRDLLKPLRRLANPRMRP